MSKSSFTYAFNYGPSMRSAHHIAKLDCCSGVRTSIGKNGRKRVLFFRRPTFVPACWFVSQATTAPAQQVQQQQNSFQDFLKSLRFYKSQVNLRHLDKLHQLVVLLQKHPEVSADVWKAGIVSTLIELKDCGRLEVERQARLALALLGYAPPCSGRGIRVLSVDGGGTRGLIPILILKHLEELCNVKTYKMFDYVCGTSTGAILTALLCLKRSSIQEVEGIYRELSAKVFKVNNLLGIGQLFLNHAFYDAKLLEKIIRREPQSEQLLIEIAADPLAPKFSFVSTVVNQPVIQPFLFTNYRHHPEAATHYQNSCDVKIWEAIMASTAAPGYFSEVKLGKCVHQDGGLLTNNPCAIALHEARLLWGKSVPIQCIVSLGTGLYLPQQAEDGDKGGSLNSTSLREKLTKIAASATDTEAVHTILKDLLPFTGYFRFNPELSVDIPMDESNPAKLDQMMDDAKRYVEAHKSELQQAAACLLESKTPRQKVQEWTSSQWNKLFSRMRYLTSS